MLETHIRSSTSHMIEGVIDIELGTFKVNALANGKPSVFMSRWCH